MKVMFFPNGNTAVFDKEKQVPKLQISWFKQYIHFLVSIDTDPTEIEFTMPNGRKAKVFETNEGYNWTIGEKP